MTMPKAAMHKHNLLVPWEHYVGPAREVLAVDPKPESQPVQHGPDDALRVGVFAADPAHEAGPGLWCKSVHPVGKYDALAALVFSSDSANYQKRAIHPILTGLRLSVWILNASHRRVGIRTLIADFGWCLRAVECQDCAIELFLCEAAIFRGLAPENAPCP